MYPLITLLSFLCLFFLLYTGFVSIVNNLTQHWCAWGHAALMCMGTPGLIGMSLCALVLSRVICLYIILALFILLYCSVCVSIYVFHSHLYI